MNVKNSDIKKKILFIAKGLIGYYRKLTRRINIIQQKSGLHFNLINNNPFCEKNCSILIYSPIQKGLFKTSSFLCTPITNKKFMLFSPEVYFMNYKIFSLHKILVYEQRNQ